MTTKMRWLSFWFFTPYWTLTGAVPEPSGLLPYPASASERQIVGIPTVKEVSAMCSTVGGIHASIEFDRPFSGRVYSLGHGETHECVYFNGYYARRLLFSIPIDKCGTQLTRNTRDIVDTLENRVYVQMDKFTLTSFDRKYAFVCELTSGGGSDVASTPLVRQPPPILPTAVREIEIRRHPSSRAHSSPASASGEIESATTLTPIVPLNAPRGATPMMPALLYYGNRQWRVPAENVRKSPASTAGGRQPLNGIQPTVIVPIEDRASKIVAPLTPDFKDLEGRGLTVGPDELSWNRISSIPDADLLHPATGRPFVDDLITTTTTSSTTSNSPITSKLTTTIPLLEADQTSIVPLFTKPSDVTLRTPIILPHAKQQPASRTFIAGLSPDDGDGSIFLEIRRDGADASPAAGRPIEGSVRIGEPITLVVHARSAAKDPSRYDIFVHSCYSSGASNLTRIQLIDSFGCSVHPLVIGQMRRERVAADEIIYYFTMRAFKFPVGDDVHFFCSVDISPDADFPALCASTSTRLARRWAPAENRRATRAVRVSNQTRVSDNQEADSIPEFQCIRGEVEDIASSREDRMVTILLVSAALMLFLAITTALFAFCACRGTKR